MLKIRYLVMVGIVAYVLFMLAHFPAVWLSSYVNRTLAPQGIALSAVSGTAWSGRADLLNASGAANLAPLQGTQVVWVLRFSGLWRGQLRADFHINGNALQLKGQLQLGWKRFGVSDTSGEISAAFLNTLLASSLQVSQPLQLSHVGLQVKRTSHPSIGASGNLFWPKGTMVLAQNPGQTLNMPDIIASLSSVKSGMELLAKAQNAPVLTVKVDATGMATITVLKRMLAVLAQPGGEADPDAMLFEFQQVVF